MHVTDHEALADYLNVDHLFPFISMFHSEPTDNLLTKGTVPGTSMALRYSAQKALVLSSLNQTYVLKASWLLV
jgi:hypothetical protein